MSTRSVSTKSFSLHLDLTVSQGRQTSSSRSVCEPQPGTRPPEATAPSLPPLIGWSGEDGFESGSSVGSTVPLDRLDATEPPTEDVFCAPEESWFPDAGDTSVTGEEVSTPVELEGTWSNGCGIGTSEGTVERCGKSEWDALARQLQEGLAHAFSTALDELLGSLGGETGSEPCESFGQAPGGFPGMDEPMAHAPGWSDDLSNPGQLQQLRDALMQAFGSALDELLGTSPGIDPGEPMPGDFGPGCPDGSHPEGTWEELLGQRVRDALGLALQSIVDELGAGDPCQDTSWEGALGRRVRDVLGGSLRSIIDELSGTSRPERSARNRLPRLDDLMELLGGRQHLPMPPSLF